VRGCLDSASRLEKDEMRKLKMSGTEQTSNNMILLLLLLLVIIVVIVMISNRDYCEIAAIILYLCRMNPVPR
jgi:hypothetical protein